MAWQSAAIKRGLNVRIARKLAGIVIALCLLAVVVLGGMIAFGTAAAPPPLSSVYDAVKAMDFSGAPPAHSFRARDGADLAYRTYSGTTDRAIVLIHGSTGSSLSVHPLAKALNAKGFTVYAPDVRGHGASGRRGDIDYIGQLDDDIADLGCSHQGAAPRCKSGVDWLFCWRRPRFTPRWR